MVFTGEYEIERAVPELVLKGEKHDVSILSVKIKGLPEADKNKILKMIAGHIHAYKAVLSEGTEGILALFNVSAKQFEHEFEAIKAAMEIASEAKNLKLNFGIGVNKGEIVLSKEKNIAKYTALGDTILLAKRISNKLLGEVLISKEVYNKVGGKIKSEKAEKASKELGEDVFIVTKISERDKYRPYLNSFVRRLKEETTQNQQKQ